MRLGKGSYRHAITFIALSKTSHPHDGRAYNIMRIARLLCVNFPLFPNRAREALDFGKGFT